MAGGLHGPGGQFLNDTIDLRATLFNGLAGIHNKRRTRPLLSVGQLAFQNLSELLLRHASSREHACTLHISWRADHHRHVDFFVAAGSFTDITAFQSMDLDLPEGSELYGDKGYVDYELEDLYAECEGIELRIPRKSNSLRPDPAWDVFLKRHFRKPIETVFSEITNLFGRTIHAVTAQGFLLKVFLFLFAFTIDGCLE